MISYEILYKCFLYYSDSHSHMYPSDGDIMQYFWDNFLYIAQGLEKLKHFFDILHECLNITVVVTKLRKCLAFLCFEHSGCF